MSNVAKEGEVVFQEYFSRNQLRLQGTEANMLRASQGRDRERPNRDQERRIELYCSEFDRLVHVRSSLQALAQDLGVRLVDPQEVPLSHTPEVMRELIGEGKLSAKVAFHGPGFTGDFGVTASEGTETTLGLKGRLGYASSFSTGERVLGAEVGKKLLIEDEGPMDTGFRLTRAGNFEEGLLFLEGMQEVLADLNTRKSPYESKPTRRGVTLANRLRKTLTDEAKTLGQRSFPIYQPGENSEGLVSRLESFNAWWNDANLGYWVQRNPVERVFARSH